MKVVTGTPSSQQAPPGRAVGDVRTPEARTRGRGTKKGGPNGPPFCILPPTWPYCTALIMSKIGRYIATTMPPTTTPRNTIIIGSRSERRPETAASTSSS